MMTQKFRGKVCAGVALLAAGAAFAQTPDSGPSFEVASVKVSPPLPPGQFKIRIGGDPGTVDYHGIHLKNVIARAYGVKENQVQGPDWLDSERFEIVAKIAPNTPPAQINLMLQNLLAERFQLKTHREKKVLPVYALIVAKPGKLKPADSADEGRFQMSFSSRGRKISGTASMPELVDSLSAMMDRPVVNLTELTGTYKIDLEWIPDEREGGVLSKMKMMAGPGGAPGAPGGSSEAPEPNGLTLFGALQESLGLKLDSRKSPVDVVTIDAGNKMPTEN